MRVDREKVRQILVNLLSNAAKFSEPGGSVVLETEVTEHQVLLHVRDSGCGIPADGLESIFERFVQIDACLTRTGDGMGLGLAISRELARGMNGDLTVASDVGRGSVFTLRIPRVA